MYNLKSKKTGKVSIVNDETLQILKRSGALKKYEATELPKPKKIIPAEIIEKRKTKSDSDND